ncbi:unnamed protein product [Prorocentrum cordatum]|uniref:Exostosin GT47 domain-containing protein n=1 Tax=Prorocentrum cordatum TaxID=2364126 RepID=A0ABN9VFU2_9DINO|nr:unnamed protein product [Polarella glacialis]
MLESKYCAVLRGSSHTNNVRLYDVIAHGCVPVVISDDFQPPLGGQLPWADMAVFLPPSELPRLAEILLAIPEERRWQLFDALVGGPHSAARALDWRSGTFWAHVLGDAARGMLAGQAGHAWRAAAEGHRAAALRRHGARRLDGPCAGVEDVLPAIAAVARSARPPVQGAVVVDADAGTGELAEGVLVGLGQLHRRRLRAASLDAGELEEAAAAECERPAEVATVVSLESSASSFRRLSLLAERQQWRLGGWAGVLGALAQEDGEAEGGQLVTLPTLQRQLFEGQDVLLLKFGPRGPQNGALAGAREALLAQKVGFVCFGYSQDAWGPRLQLQEIVRYLFSLSYACLLVAGAELFPMSGALWDDAYAQASRAAVVCAALGDDRLLQLASAFGGSAAAAAGLVLALRELYS